MPSRRPTPIRSPLFALLLAAAGAIAQDLPAVPVPEPGPVTELPDYGPTREPQLAGQIEVDPDCGAYLFFWLVESRKDPARDPLVIWLNGGPGISGLTGMFLENGPYRVEPGPEGGTRVVDNPHGWNAEATYLILDQPVGTGFSLSKGGACIPKDLDESTRELYEGIQSILARWPKYRQLDVYILGESFGGVYVPRLAQAIVAGNTAERPPIALKGIGVGSPWVDPGVQLAAEGDFAYAHGLIDLAQRDELNGLASRCAQAIAADGPAFLVGMRCDTVNGYVQEKAPGVNPYDLRLFGDDYHRRVAPVAQYLARPEVRQALHLAPETPQWEMLAGQVAARLRGTEYRSAAALYPPLLGQLRVLIYNGVYDLDTNHMGTDAWLASLDWPGKAAFAGRPRVPWTVDGKLAGFTRGEGNLTRVIFQDAGHLVAMDQPQAALEMLDRFLDGAPTSAPAPQ
jgi:cathepsin A (carboxypeptidase C)